MAIYILLIIIISIVMLYLQFGLTQTLRQSMGQIDNENSAFMLYAVITGIVFIVMALLYFSTRFISLRLYLKEVKIVDKASVLLLILGFISIFAPLAYFITKFVPAPYSLLLNLLILILLAATEEFIRKKLVNQKN